MWYRLPPAEYGVPQPPEGDEQRPDPQGPANWLRMYAAVFEFLAYLGGFGYLGYWLDLRNGWTPWGLLAGLFVGLALGLWRLVDTAKRLGLF